MRLFIAIILPWLAFFLIGRPVAGIICLVLQLLIIGWIPAAIWAAFSVNKYEVKKELSQEFRAMSDGGKS